MNAMSMRFWLRNGLLVAGLAVLAIVGLLLLATVAIAMRPVLIALLILGGAAVVVLSYVSPAFRDWFEAAGERQIQYKGLRLATDIVVHAGHGWARIAPENVTIGADDLVQVTLGPVEGVELPAVGSRIRQGDRLFSLRRGDRRVDIQAPISGTVLSRNDALLSRPELFNAGPFGEGWAVRLRAQRPPETGQRLLRGKEARNWFRRETDRMLGILVSHGAAMRTAADGGVVVPELYRQIDDDAWQRLTEAFFTAEP